MYPKAKRPEGEQGARPSANLKANKPYSPAYSVPTDQTSASASRSTSTGFGGPTEHLDAAKTILLVGETGSGKSTLVNYLANYFMEGSMSALKVVIPTRLYQTPTETGFAVHSEANLDDPTVSQTTKCATYSFQKNGVTYHFVDTPGLSDTSDSAVHCVDDETVDTILATAAQIKRLHAIVLTINGSTPKMTPNLSNALQRIAGNFPDALHNNLIVIFTNSFMKTPNFDLTHLPSTPRKYFTMNNSSFSSRQDQWDEEEALIQGKYWTMTMKKIGEMLECINLLTPQSAQAIEGIRDNRGKIKAELMRAITDIQALQKLVEKCEELKREEEISQQKISHDQMTTDFSQREIDSLRAKERLLETNAGVSASREFELMNQRQIIESSLEEALRSTREHLGRLIPQNTNSQLEVVEAYEDLVHLAERCLMCRKQIEDLESRRRAMNEKNRYNQHTLEATRTEKKTAEAHSVDVSNRLVARKEEKGQIQAKREQVEVQLLEASQSLQSAKAEVEQKCRELKAVCGQFNFVAELAPARDALVNSLRTLSGTESRNRARDFVEHLDRLTSELENAAPLVGKAKGRR